ncbi:MAG: carboxypeptidase-like regulatory domain-containing protein [Candidatus Njordarchaeales archaeon]
MKRQVLAIILVALMILPPILSSGIDIFLARAEKREKNIMVQLNTPDSQGRIVLKPIDTEILENKPEATISGVETVKASGITWTNPPGTWWDTDWEYRINVTVTEPEVVDRVDWPVDIYVTFDPPAYKYSIRVIDASSFQEIPSQIWNVTYYNSSHLTAATVTFLVNLAKGASKVYQIYWSVDFTDPPNYSKRISITAESTAYGDKYIITSKIYGWGIEIPATNGGKAANITLPNGNKIGADWLHFGPTRQPTFSYLGYWGTGDTNNARYENRYIYGTGDTLLELYQGVIFVTYVVEGVPLYDSTRQNDTAKVDFSYRIFDRYILVNEKIAWLIDDSGVDYFVGGWVFDQDDGLGDSTFNCVANDTSYIYKPSETVTFSGSITNPNGRSFRGSTNIPLLAVYRVYWTAGTHTVDLTNFYYNGDDTYIYVYDEAGNLIIRDYDYNQPSSYSITVNTDGYYYIALGSYGDDNRDGFVEFDVAIDGVTVDTDVRVGDFDTRDGYTVHPASIMMHAITIPANAETCTVDLLWTDDTQNLDLFLYGPPGSNSSMANVLYSSEATTGTEEKIVFTPTIAGNYTILVYKNSGSEVATTYTLYATLGNAFEINDYYSLDTLDHVAFLHNGTGNGIGYVFLGDRSSGVTFTSASLIWYNDGNDSEKDYVYTTRLYRGVTATTGSALEVSYSVIPFNATAASVDSSYAIFKDLKSAIKNPLQTSKNVKERFKIVTKVKVVDNDNSAVRGVTIEFINSTGQVEYSATTNASGYAVLDIVRKSYTIKATLTSGGITQTTSVNKDYSTYSYDILSDDVLITFTGIIRFRLQALTNRSLEGPKEYIQSARIVLSNSTHVIDTQTNLTGWIDLYLSIGSWTIAFNATSTATPDPWDTISIYNDSALLPDNRTAGPSENVTITLTKGWIYYLVDHDVTEAPPATKLSLFNTLTFYDVYWGETVKIQVNFTRTDAGEGIDGEVRWYVINSSGGAELSGIATKQTIGGFSFEVNTSNLDAGEYYTILVNGTPADPSFLLPSPITVGLSVKERPTALDVSFNPPGPVIYWNESLSITTIFSDSILGTGITGASVEVIIYATQTIVIPLNDLGDGSYTATVKTVLESLDAGSYLLVVRASKKNYVLNEKSFTLIINARPTTIYYDNYIEIPWQSLYTITIHYIDDRFSEEIADADVRYVLKEAATGNIILGPSQMSFPGTAWIASLDLTQVDEGLYYRDFRRQEELREPYRHDNLRNQASDHHRPAK